MPTSKFLLAEFSAIDSYIAAVRETLRDGHMPDMRGLDSRVADICAALKESPPDVQKECLPKLAEMLDHLDECERDLRAFNDEHLQGD